MLFRSYFMNMLLANGGIKFIDFGLAKEEKNPDNARPLVRTLEEWIRKAGEEKEPVKDKNIYIKFAEEMIKKLKSASSGIGAKGGIAFNALPIQAQALPISSFAFPVTRNPFPARNLDLDQEWAQIQAMVKANIRPSPQRLVEYGLAVCRDRTMFCPYEEERDKLIGLCADVLRNEEVAEQLPPTEEAIKKLLKAIESDNPLKELQLAST